MEEQSEFKTHRCNRRLQVGKVVLEGCALQLALAPRWEGRLQGIQSRAQVYLLPFLSISPTGSEDLSCFCPVHVGDSGTSTGLKDDPGSLVVWEAEAGDGLGC